MKQRVLSLALCGLALLSGCSQDTVQEEIWELEAEDVAAFPDGENADRWRGYKDGLREPWAVYELSDGTVLLLEDDPAGPEGDAAYAALSEEVQAAVLAWWQGGGRRYDLEALLAGCYARWQEQGAEAYQPGRVGQSLRAAAAGPGAVCFVLTVEEAADPAAGRSQRYSLLIDRETGQRLDVWSLFTVPEAEARQAIAAAAGDDPDVRQRLAAAIDPERVLFYPEWLEVEFPAGAFDGLDSAYILAVDYADLGGVVDSRILPAAGSPDSAGIAADAALTP